MVVSSTTAHTEGETTHEDALEAERDGAVSEAAALREANRQLKEELAKAIEKKGEALVLLEEMRNRAAGGAASAAQEAEALRERIEELEAKVPQIKPACPPHECSADGQWKGCAAGTRKWPAEVVRKWL